MNTSVAIVAAHPDDEVLGVGGTAARLSLAGTDVHVLVVSEGATSRGNARERTSPGSEVSTLQQAGRTAAKFLGIKSTTFLGLPDNRLDSLDFLDVTKEVEKFIVEVGPTTVYTHFDGDLNVDHRVVSLAVQTACRPLPGMLVTAIYAFETPSSTEWAATGRAFRPTLYVDISTTLDRKVNALEAYQSEMRAFPHARSYESVEALAKLRGAQSGLFAAEAFEVIRKIRR